MVTNEEIPRSGRREKKQEVACGTEARKMVEGNDESLFVSQDNHQQALKAIYGSEYKCKQGAEDKHQQEISGLNFPLLHRYRKGAEEDIYQPEISGLNDLSLLITYRKGEKEDIHQQEISGSNVPLLFSYRKQGKDEQGAKAMEDVLRVCELQSLMKGETKYCATSAEAMVNFVQGFMGEKPQIEALSTTTHFLEGHSTTPLQNYTILDVQEVAAPKMVACHMMHCVYTVFYCHHIIDDKRMVFKVSLGNEANGDRVETMAACHFDTSEWSTSHVSFQVLGILPGTSPFCHFFTSSNDIVWVPKTIDAGHEVRSLKERST
ncbi:hypothetical protein T459_13833 [Capsicum annuum]|uniref:BURP domain-containing protein n=2 Tax=Capsicum annuum TaxID=4072 RepID=A0A2G2ZFQ8_CAPAN|nr:putative inactive receptor kinase-like [Capsicum annuum]PHT80818.1 hypothetical protein T459_13833 [Capsicum annuum]